MVSRLRDCGAPDGAGCAGSVGVLASDALQRTKLYRWLSLLGHRVSSVGPGEPAPDIAFFAAGSLDVSALRHLHEARERLGSVPLVVLASSLDYRAAVDAIQHGATECIAWPATNAEAEVALSRVLTRFIRSAPTDWCTGCLFTETCTMDLLRDTVGATAGSLAIESPVEALRENDYPFLAGSAAMREIDRLARRLADTDLTILIRGPSGTGKEVVARHLHRTSTRREGPFVKVNCAALPEALLESELFGHARGAFTGAGTSRKGRFEEAHGGTIFLDEISEMPVGLQAKLLGVLQDKRFTPLGRIGSVSVDTRILAATNRELEEEVAGGRFREDLYFRLKVIEMDLPPLKDRREEIPLLLEYFSCRLSQKLRRPAPEIDEALLRMLLSYDWPGNVRELENLVKRAMVLGTESILNQLLDQGMTGGRATDAPDARRRDQGLHTVALKTAAAEAAVTAERELILSVLERTRWNRKKAAKLLGVSYRTLRSKIKRYDLESPLKAP